MTNEDIKYIDEIYGSNLTPLFRKGLLNKLKKIQKREEEQSNKFAIEREERENKDKKILCDKITKLASSYQESHPIIAFDILNLGNEI